MHAQRTCKTTMCRPRAFSRLLCVLHADKQARAHGVNPGSEKENKGNSVGTYCRGESRMLTQPATLDWRPMSWQVQRSSQTPGGRGWEATKWPLLCASLQTHTFEKNINIYIFFFKSAIFQLTPIIQGPADFLFPLSVLKSTSRDSIEFFSHSGQFITAFYLSTLQAGSVPENPNKTDFI